ncbi:hypothetical protein PANT111_40017 [Pantoea brenneri]|uniref:Uncharacterized protein n=1 Tax=Pantoea brenneri TaxID=472694 RepID=A0AAX3JA25_9GAMM|nr:hypothetical protein PANT111_40017 [Pantoea brenneri]
MHIIKIVRKDKNQFHIKGFIMINGRYRFYSETIFFISAVFYKILINFIDKRDKENQRTRKKAVTPGPLK